MNTTKRSLYAASMIACGCVLFTAPAAETVAIEPSSAPPPYRPWTLGVEVGTTGLGPSLSWRFADHLGSDPGSTISSIPTAVLPSRGELGVTYTGEPDVSLAWSGAPSALLDAAVNYEKGQVENYADKFKWWPVVKIMVTYSF